MKGEPFSRVVWDKKYLAGCEKCVRVYLYLQCFERIDVLLLHGTVKMTYKDTVTIFIKNKQSLSRKMYLKHTKYET